MNKLTKLKALMLSLLMVSAMTSFAQNDNFVTPEEYNNRDFATTWSITNNSFGAPLGSGLLILTAVGAGYAMAKRRRNRKSGTMLLLALAMIVGMTGCKKKIAEPAGPIGTKYTINLRTGNGSKVNVDGPDVTFTNGDKLLVAYNGKYVGTITHDGTKFTGSITTTISGTKPLYFYFLGNKDAGTLTAGTTTSCTVNISDQTTELPVISMAPSKESFPSSGNTYTASLHNKASLMKFNVTTPSTSPICITGMNNKVIIDFSKAANDVQNNGFSYDKEDGGIIKLKGGSGDNVEKWAIVLQQDALTAGAEGTAYTEDFYVGARSAVPAITMDQYLNEDRTMTVSTLGWDGDLSNVTNSSTEAFATATMVWI